MSILNALFGNGGAGETQAAVDQYKNIPLPVLKQYFPEQYKQIVQLHPELEDTTTLGPSQMEGISTDPRLKQAQLAALQQLQTVGSNGGLTDQDKAQLNDITNAS